MPEGADQDERTESATPRRKEEARKKGQVAKSVDLTSAAMFLVGLLAMRFVFPSIYSELMVVMKNTFSMLNSEWWNLDASSSTVDNSTQYPVANMKYLTFSIAMAVARAMAPFALIMVCAALAVNYAQVGFLISEEALQPKFDRLDPIKGASNLISKRTLVMFLQSLLKVFIIGYVLYITAKGELGRIVSLADMPVKMAVSHITGLVFKMALRAAVLLFMLAVFDYAYQRWEYERGLRMTKQEIKDEMRQSEGDPMVKSRMRSIQRETAARRMMQEIPTADVVITNPTHIAVALKYEKEASSAPKVCAKGARLIAERIKEIARENNIPIIEDKPLARMLFKLDLGTEIPVTLYKAVAEILARILSMDQ